MKCLLSSEWMVCTLIEDKIILWAVFHPHGLLFVFWWCLFFWEGLQLTYKFWRDPPEDRLIVHSLQRTLLSAKPMKGRTLLFRNFHITWQINADTLLLTLLLFNSISTMYCYCHRASWGSVVRCKTRDRIERITRTAVLFDLPLGAFIAQFSCNSCHICKTFHAIHGFWGHNICNSKW